MAKEKEAPEKIKKFYDLHQKVDIMMNETDMSHTKAYNTAYDKVLAKRKLTHKDLDDEKLAEEFGAEMADEYLKRVRARLGLGGKVDDMDEQMLLSKYGGLTRDELIKMVKQTGKDYTSDRHKKTMDNIIDDKGLERELRGIASAKIEDKDAGEVADYVGVKFLNPEKLRAPDLHRALSDYKKGKGAVQEDQWRKHVAYKKAANG